MKQFQVAVLLALTLTHGSFAEDGVSRMRQYIENMKAKISQDIHEFVNKPELKEHTELFVEDKQTELELLGVKIQDQLRDMEDGFKPLTETMKDKVDPLIAGVQQKMESVLQMLEEHVNHSRQKNPTDQHLSHHRR
ncbi:type-4 ice-structuring protein-like [Poeciliopsis prolifica]|uniref:type-4 ice-structuring protein-like n=1 Tax=Poeciliopsis prolifica TaxID=188132 RepID=UPI0024136480|nr:type-4 ice-structuring protein-like [Poeciliopsis prolifica]